MTTPASWLRHALDALRREGEPKDSYARAQRDCGCEDPVPAWTAEDEISLQRRIVAVQEQRERSQAGRT